MWNLEVHTVHRPQAIEVKAYTPILQEFLGIPGIQLHSSTSYEIIVINWLEGVENLVPWRLSRPKKTQLVDFDGEHEHRYFKPFCKALAPTSAISTSTGIMSNAPNPNSIYFDEYLL
jgi:hypothetical protein